MNFGHRAVLEWLGADKQWKTWFDFQTHPIPQHKDGEVITLRLRVEHIQAALVSDGAFCMKAKQVLPGAPFAFAQAIGPLTFAQKAEPSIQRADARLPGAYAYHFSLWLAAFLRRIFGDGLSQNGLSPRLDIDLYLDRVIRAEPDSTAMIKAQLGHAFHRAGPGRSADTLANQVAAWALGIPPSELRVTIMAWSRDRPSGAAPVVAYPDLNPPPSA